MTRLTIFSQNKFWKGYPKTLKKIYKELNKEDCGGDILQIKD